MKNARCILYLLVLPLTAHLQGFTGIYQPPANGSGNGPAGAKSIPYAYVREADIAWQKRVWVDIDMREKQNQVLYYPVEPDVSRKSFLQLVVSCIFDGSITAYADEDFTMPLKPADLRRRLVIKGDSVEQTVYTPEGDERVVKVPGYVDSLWIFRNFQSITLKEDWFFDCKQSALDVRIIAAGFNAAYVGKEDLGAAPQFWIYFPSCRDYLARYAVLNPQNDAAPLTFDQLFRKRMFHGTIVKESNVFDRTIAQYAKGLDGLYESERIKTKILQWESDLWQY